ncbi:hypothetical protein [Campylobacter corcagiensis]|uniref:Uncharacterized protein n=1 Tax=Campylobacter corcagiensis TaxID=1448857 RepID=A0A7M1LG03_9BACT|nr:hypothetical protein [Campylobacter corcagiensis]QKF65020.1 hypothetical protein CCORG_1171 [Campylobacter corcagiensis]QOQ86826.1 hypothetical protein IMC76_06310 [Campylobacter corcagiensis]
MLFSGVPHTGDIVHCGTLLFKKAKHLVTEPKAIDKFKANDGNNQTKLNFKFLLNL